MTIPLPKAYTNIGPTMEKTDKTPNQGKIAILIPAHTRHITPNHMVEALPTFAFSLAATILPKNIPKALILKSKP